MTTDTIRHWKIGDVEVARIVEVNNWEDDIAMLLPDGKPDYVQKFPWLVPHFATPAGRMLISFQCFVLRSRDRSVMIDTCIGNDREREYPVFCNMQTSFLEDLAAAGVPTASVWQWAQNCKIPVPGGKLLVDLDVASTEDPSLPTAADAAVSSPVPRPCT